MHSNLHAHISQPENQLKLKFRVFFIFMLLFISIMRLSICILCVLSLPKCLFSLVFIYLYFSVVPHVFVLFAILNISINNSNKYQLLFISLSVNWSVTIYEEEIA